MSTSTSEMQFTIPQQEFLDQFEKGVAENDVAVLERLAYLEGLDASNRGYAKAIFSELLSQARLYSERVYSFNKLDRRDQEFINQISNQGGTPTLVPEQALWITGITSSRTSRALIGNHEGVLYLVFFSGPVLPPPR